MNVEVISSKDFSILYQTERYWHNLIFEIQQAAPSMWFVIRSVLL